MIFHENRLPVFGMMLYPFVPAAGCGGGANWPDGGAGAKVGCVLAGVIGWAPIADGCAFGLDFEAAFISPGAGFFFTVLALTAAPCGS